MGMVTILFNDAWSFEQIDNTQLTEGQRPNVKCSEY